MPRERNPNAVVNCAEIADGSVRAPTDGLWIDYVADIGDSWEATYSIRWRTFWYQRLSVARP